MAERATPDIVDFKKRFKISWANGIIPQIKLYPTPYSEAFYWRYNWANKYCKQKEVLEIPCGMGWGTSLLTKAKFVTGIDISEEAIEEANKRYSNNKRRFEIGTMKKLSFDNNKFDIVVCLEGIEHVEREIGEEFIKEASRVLKSNGLLLLSSPRHKTKEHSGNPYHVIEYNLHELIELLSPYFNVNIVVKKEVDDLNVYFIVAQLK